MHRQSDSKKMDPQTLKDYFLQPKSELKISKKSSWGGTRNIPQLAAEGYEAFMTPSKLNGGLLGDYFYNGELLWKAFFFSPTYEQYNRVPKDIDSKNIKSPLVYQFAVERNIAVKKIVNDVLLFWGLLSQWIKDSNETIQKLQKQIDEAHSSLTSFIGKFQLSSYRIHMAELEKQKFHGIFSQLYFIQAKLKEFIAQQTKDQGTEKDEKKWDDKETWQAMISDPKAKESVEEFLVEVVKFIETIKPVSAGITSNTSTPMRRQSTKSSMVQTSLQDEDSECAKAIAYLKKITCWLEQIQQSPAALKWQFLEKAHEKAKQISEEFFPQHDDFLMLCQWLNTNKQDRAEAEGTLQAINGQLIADSADEEKVDFVADIKKAALTGLPKLIAPEKMKLQANIMAFYQYNQTYFSKVIEVLDQSTLELEAIVNMAGLFEQLEILDDLTGYKNEISTDAYKALNRSSRLLATVMKFLLYYTEIREGFDSDIKDTFNTSKTIVSSETSATTPVAPTRVLLDRNKSRLILQKKSEQAAAGYLKQHKNGLLDFLYEHGHVEKPESEISETLVPTLGRFITIMTAAVNFFNMQFNQVNNYFGKGRGRAEQKLFGLFSSQVMMTSAKPVFQEAAFFIPVFFPLLRDEVNYWNDVIKKSKWLFPYFPEIGLFVFNALSENMRSQFTLEKLEKMFESAKQDKYYNLCLRLAIEYIKVERECAKQWLGFVKQCENNLAAAERGDKVYQDTYNDSTKTLAKFHATTAFICSFLEKLLPPGEDSVRQSADPAIFNLWSLLSAKKNALDKLKQKNQNSKKNSIIINAYSVWDREYNDVLKRLGETLGKEQKEMNALTWTLKQALVQEFKTALSQLSTSARRSSGDATLTVLSTTGPTPIPNPSSTIIITTTTPLAPTSIPLPTAVPRPTEPSGSPSTSTTNSTTVSTTAAPVPLEDVIEVRDLGEDSSKGQPSQNLQQDADSKKTPIESAGEDDGPPLAPEMDATPTLTQVLSTTSTRARSGQTSQPSTLLEAIRDTGGAGNYFKSRPKITVVSSPKRSVISSSKSISSQGSSLNRVMGGLNLNADPKFLALLASRKKAQQTDENEDESKSKNKNTRPEQNKSPFSTPSSGSEGDTAPTTNFDTPSSSSSGSSGSSSGSTASSTPSTSSGTTTYTPGSGNPTMFGAVPVATPQGSGSSQTSTLANSST